MTGLSLALANLKPGTGKTTSAVWLAHVFAQAGNSVLLVDADPSGSALEWSDLAAMYPGLPPQAASCSSWFTQARQGELRPLRPGQRDTRGHASKTARSTSTQKSQIKGEHHA